MNSDNDELKRHSQGALARMRDATDPPLHAEELPIKEQIASLEQQLKTLRQREIESRRQRLWKLVDHLDNDDLAVLRSMIHDHLFGDSDDELPLQDT